MFSFNYSKIIIYLIIITVSIIISLSSTANVRSYNVSIAEKHYVHEPINGYSLYNRADLKTIIDELKRLNLTYTLFSGYATDEIYYLSNDPNSVIDISEGDLKFNGYTYKKIDVNKYDGHVIFINTDFNEFNINSVVDETYSVYYDVYIPVFGQFYYIIFVIIILLIIILSIFMSKKSSNFIYVYSLLGFSKLKIIFLILKNNLVYFMLFCIVQLIVFIPPLRLYQNYFTDFSPIKYSIIYLLMYNLVFIICFISLLIVLPLTKNVEKLRKEVTNV